jgi:hypothetical protein
VSAVRRPEPTEQELRAAWHVCRARARSPWPDTFEQAMADATLSRLVRITALHPQRGHRPAPAPAAITARRRPAFFDHKRAAAGDRDDD